MASAYEFISPGAGFPGVSDTGTDCRQRLGLIADAFDPTYGVGKFMYVQGAAASTLAAGEVGILSNYSAGQAYSANTASHGIMGIVPAALSATNVYGWMQIEGVVDYAKFTNTTAAAGLPVYIGSTAGRLHVAESATGFQVEGAWISQYSATSNSNSGIVQLYYPHYNGR
jgi:hypothetical protein